MENATILSDADVIEHLTSPLEGKIEPIAARAILQIKFDKAATKQIGRLLQKNARGAISAEERLVLERFLRVGKLIDFLHAKAYLSLKEAELPI